MSWINFIVSINFIVGAFTAVAGCFVNLIQLSIASAQFDVHEATDDRTGEAREFFVTVRTMMSSALAVFVVCFLLSGGNSLGAAIGMCAAFTVILLPMIVFGASSKTRSWTADKVIVLRGCRL